VNCEIQNIEKENVAMASPDKIYLEKNTMLYQCKNVFQ